MNHFIITYRIKHDEAYQGRYDSFIRRVKEFSPDAFWNETSSFYALTAAATAAELCHALCAETGFDCTKDSVVVIDTTSRSMATSGAIQNRGLLEQCVGF